MKERDKPGQPASVDLATRLQEMAQHFVTCLEAATAIVHDRQHTAGLEAAFVAGAIAILDANWVPEHELPPNVIPIGGRTATHDDIGQGSHFTLVVGRVCPYKGDGWEIREFIEPAEDPEARVHDPEWCSDSPCTCSYGISTNWHPGDGWFTLRLTTELPHETRRGPNPRWPTMYRPVDFNEARRVATECSEHNKGTPERLLHLLDLLERRSDLWIGVRLGPKTRSK